MPQFEIVSEYEPRGDQPQAIASLVKGIARDDKEQVLVGVTGSGKTYIMANVIEQIQRPTLVLAHNKTLAGQLAMEFKEFFPHNACEYFVSYYDYYQPEAYLPQTDTYIEKDSQINEEIDRLRHSATQSLKERRDVVVVASVSCIFGLGSPEQYEEIVLSVKRGQEVDRDELLRQLVRMQFSRNDIALDRGTFRARGDVIEIHPVDQDLIIRLELYGDELERIVLVDQLTGEIMEGKERITVYPATHFVASRERLDRALQTIDEELEERLAFFHREGKLLEAQRLEQRTRYDLEMIKEIGYCSGIENYSRHMDGRLPGQSPYTLLDYFPDDFLMIIDESHQTIPQLRAMYSGDRSRKETLVNFGFRLPSAFDNRPLQFPEWQEKVGQVVYLSATPGPYELSRASQVVECVVRPTGLLDPEIEIRPTEGQIDDLVAEVRKRVEHEQRVLVTTLTKRMSEDLTDYLAELGVRVHYMHSDVETLDRHELLRNLRLGEYDVLVGINLLREGLDLPEVSLVAILDADKEGFLRSETALVQTMGRAARHLDGRVIMYADRETAAMKAAIGEVNRRRAKQAAYNEEHGIVPQSIQKSVRDTIRATQEVQAAARRFMGEEIADRLKAEDLQDVIGALESDMKKAASDLDFERAAELRDEIKELKALLAS